MEESDMRLFSSLVTVLLLLAILPVFLSAPTPHTQTLTTVTSLQTITTEMTVTTARAVTSYVTETTVFTESAVTTSYYPSNKVSTPYKTDALIIDKVPERYGCFYWWFDFSAKKNEVLTANLTSNIPIAFYVMSDDDFWAWRKQGLCEVEKALEKSPLVQEYSQSVVIPSNGKYHLVMMNWSHEDMARVKFSSRIIGLVIESSQVVTSAVVLTSESTTTETYPTTMTQVRTSVWTEELGFPLQQNILLIGAVIVVVVIAVVAFLVVRMSKTRRKPQHEEARTVQPAQAKFKYCTACGKQLPIEAKFCDNCRTTQPS